MRPGQWGPRAQGRGIQRPRPPFEALIAACAVRAHVLAPLGFAALQETCCIAKYRLMSEGFVWCPAPGQVKVTSMNAFGSHRELADVATDVLRSCALTAAQTVGAQACQGLSLWLCFLGAPRTFTGTVAGTSPQWASGGDALDVAGEGAPAASIWPWIWAPLGAKTPAQNQSRPSLPWTDPVLSPWQPFVGWTALGALGNLWLAWSQSLTPSPLAIAGAIAGATKDAVVVADYPRYRSADGHAVAQLVMPVAF
jgi:hypothetical protein